jgi:hypothetical protein
VDTNGVCEAKPLTMFPLVLEALVKLALERTRLCEVPHGDIAGHAEWVRMADLEIHQASLERLGAANLDRSAT